MKARATLGLSTAIALAVTLLAGGCGGGSSSPSSPSPPISSTAAPFFPVPAVTPDIAGIWHGKVGLCGRAGVPIKVELAQSDDTVSGTWADSVAINWKGTIAGKFINPGEMTATVTFASHGRVNDDTCTGIGTITWKWNTGTGLSQMRWLGEFTWTGGSCTCASPCLSYPAQVDWDLRPPGSPPPLLAAGDPRVDLTASAL